jgi:hypothetical protein
MEPSRFLADLPPELFGLAPKLPAAPAVRGPTIRRPPGSLPGEPHIEIEDDGPREPPPRRALPPARSGPVVDYSFDQRPEAAGTLARGTRVVHASLGEGRSSPPRAPALARR